MAAAALQLADDLFEAHLALEATLSSARGREEAETERHAAEKSGLEERLAGETASRREAEERAASEAAARARAEEALEAEQKARAGERDAAEKAAEAAEARLGALARRLEGR